MAGHARRNHATSGVSPERLLEIWGGKRESNPQPSEPQSGALPVELFPPPNLIIAIALGAVRRAQSDLRRQTSDFRRKQYGDCAEQNGKMSRKGRKPKAGSRRSEV